MHIILLDEDKGRKGTKYVLLLNKKNAWIHTGSKCTCTCTCRVLTKPDLTTNIFSKRNRNTEEKR